MATIYKMKGGKPTPISTRQQKRDIMQWRGWTEEQYRKQYDMLKNRLRAYEAYKTAHGEQVQKQSPQEFLYRQSKSMHEHGAEYVPSRQMQNIMTFPAYSISKSREIARDPSKARRIESSLRARVLKDFDELIQRNHVARDIVEHATNAIQMKNALDALAKDLREFQKTGAKPVTDGEGNYDFDEWGEAIPVPEADYTDGGSGSDPSNFDVDYTKYLV